MNKKSPKGIRPRRCSPPPPRGVKYATVTQDKSPCLCSERHDEYLFGRAKTGGLGQVTTQKKKKQEMPQGHWTPLFFSSSQGAKYVTVTQHTSPRRVNFKVCDLSYLWRVCCHSPLRLLRTLLPVITWIPDSMNPIPHSLVIPLS